jgi:hypothetical protein
MVEAAGGGLQPGVHFGPVRGGVEEARVPVPAPAPVRPAAQVLGQSRQVARTRPVGQVGGDGVGRLVGRGEAVFGMGAHEGEHAIDAFGFHARRHVDEHQRAQGAVVELAGGEQPGDAAERGPHHHRGPVAALGHVPRHGDEVPGIVLRAVGRVGDPLAVAVAALVVGERDPAARGKRPRRAAP